MNKQDFLRRLKAALNGLPEDEIRKTIDYYSEIIDDAIEDGRNEDDVIDGFGSVESIAEKVINETPIRKLVTEGVRRQNISAGAIILIILGAPVWLPIAAVFFTVLMSIYIILWSIVISVFAVFAVFVLVAVGMIILIIPLLLASPVKAAMAFGTALLCAGVSVFLFYASVLSAKLVIRLTVLMARQVKKMFVRKGSETR